MYGENYTSNHEIPIPNGTGILCRIHGSPIVDGPEVYDDRDSAQREAEGRRASMDYSEFDLTTSTIIFATDCVHAQ